MCSVRARDTLVVVVGLKRREDMSGLAGRKPLEGDAALGQEMGYRWGWFKMQPEYGLLDVKRAVRIVFNGVAASMLR